MELKKTNLHMDRIKCQVNTQITLEEDKNISDRCPDAAAILIENGKVVLEETRPMTDHVLLRGKLQYEVLCESEIAEKRWYRIQGEIPWEEKIRAEGLESMDTVQVNAFVENIKCSLIHSRKLNIRALLNFQIIVKELYDEEILTGIEGEQQWEVKKEAMELSVLAIDKKDVFRVKEDLELPSFLPPIREVLWKSLELEKTEIKVLEDSIRLQGEVRVFLLYESEGDPVKVKAYETTIPFSGNVECSGCNSHMVAKITPQVTHQNLSIKEDYDGEDRVLDVEMMIELSIRMYERRWVEHICDIYSNCLEVTPEFSEMKCKKIWEPIYGRSKITKEIKTKNTDQKILQICHVQCKVEIEETACEKEGLKMQGILNTMILYLEDREEEHYEVIKKELPFTCELENIILEGNCGFQVRPILEQQSASVVDEYSMEIKVLVGFEVTVEETNCKTRITEITKTPYDPESVDNRAGMIVYIPSKKETLWDIGKRYKISMESIKKVNDFTEEVSELPYKEMEKDQRIWLVREN